MRICIQLYLDLQNRSWLVYTILVGGKLLGLCPHHEPGPNSHISEGLYYHPTSDKYENNEFLFAKLVAL